MLQAAQIKEAIKAEKKKKDNSGYKSSSIAQGDGKYLSSLYRYTGTAVLSEIQ